MLSVYETMIEVMKGLRPVVTQIQGRDRDPNASVETGVQQRGAPRISAGIGSNRGHAKAVPQRASGRRGRRCAYLDVAMACGYVGHIDAALLDGLDKVRAVLVKNVV